MNRSRPTRSYTGQAAVRKEVSKAKKPPLTHFLSLPIGHHPALRDNWTQISKRLLESSPAIPGLHESIIVKPGSLHLTLGVLSLASRKPEYHTATSKVDVTSETKVFLPDEVSETPESAPARELSTAKPPPQNTVDEALDLLRTLKTPIKEMLNGEDALTVPLERIDVMRSRPNQNLEQSHVMWAGPDPDSVAGKRLSRVCELVYSTFKNVGMLQDDRPLKLHCTLINTVYRKEKGTQKDRRWKNRKRTPFSFWALLSSSVYARIGTPVSAEVDIPEATYEPCKVNLGSWTVDEVQLCEMGSKDADGVYRSVGSIMLHD